MPRKIRVLILFVAALLLMSACSSDSSELDAANARVAELEQELLNATSSTVTAVETIEGTISLALNDAPARGGSSCTGKGGYDDIREGSNIVVRDGSGITIGTSSLEAGEVTEVKIIDGGDPNRFVLRKRCVFAFAVDAPADVGFYEVEVSHRGGLTYSNAEMVAQEWTVILTLG